MYVQEEPSPIDPSHFPSWPARSEGSKRAKKASPKAPEGGDFYKSLVCNSFSFIILNIHVSFLQFFN